MHSTNDFQIWLFKRLKWTRQPNTRGKKLSLYLHSYSRSYIPIRIFTFGHRRSAVHAIPTPTFDSYGCLLIYTTALQHGAVKTACDTGAGQEEMWFDLIKPSTTCKLRVLVNFKSENIIRFIKIGRFSSHRMNITHYNYTAKQTLYFFHDVCESRYF
jgi:hypothetical protein